MNSSNDVNNPNKKDSDTTEEAAANVTIYIHAAEDEEENVRRNVLCEEKVHSRKRGSPVENLFKDGIENIQIVARYEDGRRGQRESGQRPRLQDQGGNQGQGGNQSQDGNQSQSGNQGQGGNQSQDENQSQSGNHQDQGGNQRHDGNQGQGGNQGQDENQGQGGTQGQVLNQSQGGNQGQDRNQGHDENQGQGGTQGQGGNPVQGVYYPPQNQGGGFGGLPQGQGPYPVRGGYPGQWGYPGQYYPPQGQGGGFAGQPQGQGGYYQPQGQSGVFGQPQGQDFRGPPQGQDGMFSGPPQGQVGYTGQGGYYAPQSGFYGQGQRGPPQGGIFFGPPPRDQDANSPQLRRWSEPTGIPMEKEERGPFVRKVFSVLFICMIVTCTFAVLTFVIPGTRTFFSSVFGLLLGFYGMATLIIMSCVMMISQCSRQSPCNVICLVITVVAECLFFGFITARFKLKIILVALIVTTVIVLVCLGLAFTPIDFTKCYMYLLVACVALLMFYIVYMTVTLAFKEKFTVTHLIMGLLFTLLQSLIFIMELQMILGGRTLELDSSQWAIGVFFLYTSIMTIFYNVLSVIGVTDFL